MLYLWLLIAEKVMFSRFTTFRLRFDLVEVLWKAFGVQFVAL